MFSWPWELPQTVVIHWTGAEYEAIATYAEPPLYGPFPPGEVAGIDLGEVHLAAAHDGRDTSILNGRLLRSKVQYRNKLQAALNSRIDGRMKQGSKRRKRLIRSKKRQLKKIEHQIQDIEHQQTSKLITTLFDAGVRTLVIGDVRNIRQGNDVGHANNQKIQCAASAPVELPIMGRRSRVDNLLGYRPDLTGKPKGEKSMVGKRLNTKICSVRRCKSCVHGET